ncbi:MAG: RT0821/Lpp0805 family surface protein [Gammaproteobacteria bacterium]
MTNKHIFVPVVVVLLGATLLVAGCATKEGTGAAIGAGAGALLGHQFGGGRGQTAMTILGAVGGALAGGAIGRSMDKKDRQQTAYALENNRTGQTSTWTNPDTGNTYAVTPTRTTTQNNEPCRTFVFKNTGANGQAQTITRLACRQPNGTWQIQNQ